MLADARAESRVGWRDLSRPGGRPPKFRAWETQPRPLKIVQRSGNRVGVVSYHQCAEIQEGNRGRWSPVHGYIIKGYLLKFRHEGLITTEQGRPFDGRLGD